ncbi:MAG: hypothetical protein WAO24_00340, partial [Peptococcia bacterium]
QIFGKLRMHLEEYLLSKCSLATTGIRPNAFNFPATPTFILEPLLIRLIRKTIVNPMVNNGLFIVSTNKIPGTH